jgi:DNA adenine methylase
MSYPQRGGGLSAPRRPILRYHGGKFKLAPWIISHFPPHKIYVEPYGGGCSVLLRKERSYGECYNDLDEQIVNVFRVLRDRDDAEELRRRLELTPYSRQEFYDAYAPSTEPIERARRTIVRSFQGFGSDSTNESWSTGFRAWSNRSGTTPAHDWARWPENIPAFIDRLRGVVIECRDAAEVIVAQDSPKTLHYVDPPYVHSTRSGKVGRDVRHRYRYEMTDDDHRKLAGVLHSVVGMVVLSGYPAPLYDELYADWTRVSTDARADGAAKRTECLWLSPATVAALHPKLIA